MKKFLTSNKLKFIACFSMLFDHIGKIIYLFFPNDTTYLVNYSFSIIGRIALPIFLFLIIEGFYHTKDIKKYFLRLGIIGTLVAVGEIVLSLIPQLALTDILFKAGNIFVDLILTLSVFYLFNSSKTNTKMLTVLPLLYFVLCLLLQNEVIYIESDILKGILSGFMSQYSFITPLIIVLFISIHYLYRKLLTNKYNEQELQTINTELLFKNVRISSFIFTITIVSLLIYLLTYFIKDATTLNTDLVINTYFIISVPFIYFYNGNKGSDNKILQKAYYLFYPIHLVIIFLITYLVSLI